MVHGSVGLYQCKDGFRLLGKNITTCNYGNWSTNPPECQEIIQISNHKLLDVNTKIFLPKVYND